MTITATIRTLAATAIAAAVVASSALAAGEPKNMLPFTHIVGTSHGLVLLPTIRHSSSTWSPAGEPKNEYPFTRR
jgi:hypothetical protein